MIVVVGGDHGVPRVTRGGGYSCGEGNGHEAETFALEVLHGGTHVFLHELSDLVLGDSHGVVGSGRRRLVAVGAATKGCGPTIGTTGLNTVSASLPKTKQNCLYNIIILL